MKIINLKDLKSLLFDNVGTKQIILKNTFWLGVAEGITQLLKLILLIYIAKILGAEDYGKFSFALAFVGLLLFLPNLVHSKITTREFARDREREKDLPSILSLRIILSLANLALIFIVLLFVNFDAAVEKIITILAGYLAIEHFLGFITFFFHSRQRMEYDALIKVIKSLLLASAVFFVIFRFPTLDNISYGYLVSALAAMIAIWLLFHLKFRIFTFAFNGQVWKRYAVMSWPFFAGSIFAAIYHHVDSVIMGTFNQIAQTGLYNAAYKIVGGATIPVGLIASSFYPVISKAAGYSSERLQRIWNYFLEIMIFFAVPFMAGGIILGPRIISFFYDASFAPAAPAFQILIIMGGIIFLQYPFYYALLVFNQQTKLLIVNLAAAVANLVLNLLLIPRYSLYGAAFVSAATYFISLAVFVVLVMKYAALALFNRRFFKTGLLAIISSAVMARVILNDYLFSLHVLWLIFMGAVVYFLAFFVLKFLMENFAKLAYAVKQ